MAKLIVALLILVPAIALAGGPSGDEQMQQKTIVIENHVPAQPADNNGVIIAAVIAGVFTLAGTVVAVRKKS